MPWEVEVTDEFKDWYQSLTVAQCDAIDDVLLMLEVDGPRLSRPHVGLIESSAFRNMKELRVSEGGALRILFMFDPRRMAILLLGGDKTGEWDAWYRTAIPEAERLYREYLEELKREGLL